VRQAAHSGREKSPSPARCATAGGKPLRLPPVAIARLFAVTPETINRAIRKARQLLDWFGPTISPAAERLTSLNDLADFAARLGITPTPQVKTAS
jgi:hypothetical protein